MCMKHRDLILQQLRQRIQEKWNAMGPIYISGSRLSRGVFKNCNRFPETLLILRAQYHQNIS